MKRSGLSKTITLPIALAVLVVAADALADFVYVNDEAFLNTISGFSVNATTGALTPLPGSPFSTGGYGSPGAFFALNRITTVTVGGSSFLYAGNNNNNTSGTVSAFQIESNGNLVTVSGSPFQASPLSTGYSGSNGLSLATTPDGQVLMVANAATEDVTTFHIGSNGALTPIGAFPLVG